MKLEKEFVLYTEAYELKQLGFDEDCFGKWLSSAQSDWKEYELILEMGMNEGVEDNRNIYLLEGACSAPTYSQAFSWFREKHGLFIQANRTIDSKGIWYYFYIETKRTDVCEGSFVYEYAELACLKKLIEIVKNK